MAPSSHLAGEAHKRFTAVATLLSLIDPVRGEPTVHNLDRHPHDRCWQPEHLQKKFLDSFAFICSTSARGRETAAAVCLEQCHPLHTILRVARNRGFPTDVISQLQQIIDTLASGASQRGYSLTTVRYSMRLILGDRSQHERTRVRDIAKHSQSDARQDKPSLEEASQTTDTRTCIPGSAKT